MFSSSWFFMGFLISVALFHYYTHVRSSFFYGGYLCYSLFVYQFSQSFVFTILNSVSGGLICSSLIQTYHHCFKSLIYFCLYFFRSCCGFLRGMQTPYICAIVPLFMTGSFPFESVHVPIANFLIPTWFLTEDCSPCIRIR